MVWYATREQLKRVTQSTAPHNYDIDFAIGAASLMVEDLTRRKFYPETGTRYFDYPTRQSDAVTLWLEQDEILSVSQIVSGGTVLDPSSYFLTFPNITGPHPGIDINKGTSGTWSSSAGTNQNSIQVTGVFGGNNTFTEVAEVVAGIDSDDLLFVVDDGSRVGVGSVLRLDDELVAVGGRGYIDIATLATEATDSKSNTVLTTTLTSGLMPGETILIDGEIMDVISSSGMSVVVRRAVDGSVLAGHPSSSTIQVSRELTISRAQLGTTATAHSSGVSVELLTFPALINQLTVAEAIAIMNQHRAAWTGQAGAEENSRSTDAAGLPGLRAAVRRAHGRNLRIGVI